ncbi:MAG TPA: flagellar assembly protein FliW [Bryobacteraceae bacterium]|nr:flagellar assembly protein FliW [Bryobacteraceae bacterium]
MPVVETKYFGLMDYREETVFHFPLGLPAFDHERRFVLVEIPDYSPLVFLQSLQEPTLCFLALPVLTIDPAYDLALSAEERAILELDKDASPGAGDVLVLALLSLHDGFSATAQFNGADRCQSEKPAHGAVNPRGSTVFARACLRDCRFCCEL